MSRKHSPLSPSNSKQWMNCPPSIMAEMNFPETESEAADEGTAAHDLAEVEISKFFKLRPIRELNKEIQEVKGRKNGNGEIYYSPSMSEYVDEYTSYVINKYVEAQKKDPAAELLLEQKVNLEKWIPNGAGFCDTVILANGSLEVVDLKYGQGVQVVAKDNSQLRLYALGAYDSLSWLFDIDSVTVTIVQPRNGGISSETMSLKDLLKWGEDEVKPKALLASKGEGEFKAGEHCRFCRAAPLCKTLADYHLEIAKYKFKDPDMLSDEEVSDILDRAGGVKKWLNLLEDYALKQAVNNGKVWPRYKLVAGISRRKISDEQKAVRLLEKEGYSRDEILKPREIKGFTDLEKLVGKARLGAILKDLIIKPQGKPTLAPESDSRPVFNSPDEVFDKLDVSEIPF